MDLKHRSFERCFFLLYFCFVQKINQLTYHQIDFKKYDTCIQNASNNRIEAYSWYLDIVTNKNWEILVYNDYQAVLPLPKQRVRKKFFQKLITQPLFCQQLGLFYTKPIDLEIKALFLEAFFKNKIFIYHFNAQNIFVRQLLKDKIQSKNNFILPLNIDYQSIYKNYKKDLLKKLKKAKKATFFIKKDVAFDDFKQIKKENSHHKIKKVHFKKMEILTKSLQQKNKGNFYGVFKDKQLVSVMFFIQTETKIIYLLSATSSQGKKTGAAAFLLDYIIQNNCNTNKTLDFEGSTIPGIAKFFMSFGAINAPYFCYPKV